MVLPIAIIIIMMTRLRRSCPVCPTWCWSGTGESSSAASSPSSSRSSFHCHCSSVLDHFWTNLIYVLGQNVAGQNVSWPLREPYSSPSTLSSYWHLFIIGILIVDIRITIVNVVIVLFINVILMTWMQVNEETLEPTSKLASSTIDWCKEQVPPDIINKSCPKYR